MHVSRTLLSLRRLAALSLAAFAALAAFSSPAEARFYQVPYYAADSFLPDGRCSLREALAAIRNRVAQDTCPAGDAGWNEIEITGEAAGTVELVLNESIEINSSVSIFSAAGSGFYRKIRGKNTRFVIKAGGSLEVSRLRFSEFTTTPFLVQGGIVSGRGFVRGSLVMSSAELSSNTRGTGSIVQTLGIFVDQGFVGLYNVVISHNVGGIKGGGILNKSGVIDLSSVTIHSNQVSQYGGAIHLVGSGASARLFNCTLSGNKAGISGGGIYNADSTTDLLWSTVTKNDSPTGAGVNVVSGAFRPKKAIIADNITGADCAGAFTSSGYNLFESCGGAITTTGDRTTTDAKLGAMTFPSGSSWALTPHHKPLSGSPAVNVIPSGACDGSPDDQIYGRRAIAGSCDIGAIERQ